VTLDAGYHSLQIDHFEAGGGQQVTLQWKTPGSSTFVLVPGVGAEHRGRRGAGDLGGQEGVRGRHRLGR
jgi:hypothetical protein